MLGALFEAQNNFKKASRYYYKAINLNDNYFEPIFNLSMIELYEGNFKLGWKHFASRWSSNEFGSKQLQSDRPCWSPSISKDHHVTIWPEQGIGDYILYSRFLNDLIQNTDHISILIHDKLKPFV